MENFIEVKSKQSWFWCVPKNIAKTGSLCCVAARPHESNAASREWSMGPQEPYWQTNTSFSPPPSRWDFRFQSDGLSYGSHDGILLYGSSTSSNSKDSRSWMRGNHLSSHQYSVSDGARPYFSSPSDMSLAPQWTPPTIQGIDIDDYETTRRDPVAEPFSFAPTMEGTTSANPDSISSSSFRSDGSEYYDLTSKSQSFSHRNISNRRSFMSKPIHPLYFPMQQTPTREASETLTTGFPELDNEAGTPQRDAHRWSSASSSVELTDVSESLESEHLGFKCVLCERYLSQKSPWSSRRIVKSSDMPVTGVLSCHHVFHAECLEQTTTKPCKNDPPCPLCVRLEEENSSSRLRNGFPKLRPFREEGPSKPWGCAQAGDCVEGALHVPPRNSMMLLNRSRVKKNLCGKEYPGKLRKSGSNSLKLFGGRSDD